MYSVIIAGLGPCENLCIGSYHIRRYVFISLSFCCACPTSSFIAGLNVIESEGITVGSNGCVQSLYLRGATFSDAPYILMVEFECAGPEGLSPCYFATAVGVTIANIEATIITANVSPIMPFLLFISFRFHLLTSYLS